MDIKTGNSTLPVTDGSRELSARVANQFVAELEHYKRSKRKTHALNNRQNLERRPASKKLELAKPENRLEVFPEKSRHFAILDDPEQNREPARLKREAGIKSETCMTLTKQYGLAKAEMEKKFPIGQVLDAALPVLKKLSLERMPFALTTTALAFTFDFLWIFVRDLLSKKLVPVNGERQADG